MQINFGESYLNDKNRHHSPPKAQFCPVTHRATVFSTFQQGISPYGCQTIHLIGLAPRKLQNRHPGAVSSRFAVKYQSASADLDSFAAA
jgi:hypothetical protein